MEATKFLYIKIQWLDYSPLLKAEGREIVDVWPFLLEEALRRRETKELNQAAQALVNALGHFPLKVLAGKDKKWQQWTTFFFLFKEKDAKALRSTAKALVKNLLGRPEQTSSAA